MRKTIIALVILLLPVSAQTIRMSPAVSSMSVSREEKAYPPASVLSNGTWIMIRTTRDGVYRLTYSDLAAMGLDDPSNVRIFGNGNRILPKMNNEPGIYDLVENRIYLNKGSDGIFNQGDYILFYGQGPVNWQYNDSSGFFEHERHHYSDGSYYFITSSPAGKERIVPESLTGGHATVTVDVFDDYLFHELSLENLLNSGRNWVGEHFKMVTTRNFDFSFPNITDGGRIDLKWKATVRSPAGSSFSILHNSDVADRIDFPPINTGSPVSPFAEEKSGDAVFYAPGGNISLTVKFGQNVPAAEGWLNYLLLNARRSLIMDGGQMHFRDSQSAGSGQLAEFRISGTRTGTRVWDITDPAEITEMTAVRSEAATIFSCSTDELRQFIAFDGSGYLEPEIIGLVPNQNLHGIRDVDMVIVTHPLFMDEAVRLASHRITNDGLDVVVVTPGEIYNEFSSGKPDISAIRNFMRMLYDRARSEGGKSPAYLLLFGKGTYDNRPGNPSGLNFIPTYQSPNSLRPTQSFVSDDFYGLLDEDEGESSGFLNVGIGRLPVTTREQAQAVVSKITGYNTPQQRGDWQNILCFIADDGDNNVHMRDADIIATEVAQSHPVFNIDKIYLDAWPRIGTSLGQRYPDVNRAIGERIKKGALIVNYTGHGNDLRLADENIIDINDVMSWDNIDRLPVFMTATCEFSRFDNPERLSAGEALILNPSGGGIALFSTTRLVYAVPNFVLNQNFYRFIFDPDLRLGDVMRLTKINSGTGINKRNFTLLGDPSMKLATPEHRVSITSVNGSPPGEMPDTLRAMEKVTIRGKITDDQGGMLEHFNGYIHHTLFDKALSLRTLGNDGNPPFSYESMHNIIYRGKATVAKGEFSFSFLVPKDIAYHFGPGKLSSFACDGNSNASGAFTSIIIGGSVPDPVDDTCGPVIELFMNDRNFIPGGLTGSNPRLLAFLSDSSGINSTGRGIGHDITLVLNDDPSRLVILNDYYAADPDTYRSGRIEYPFRDLAEGDYKLTLKAWDVFNNSSEASLNFTVSESGSLIVRNIFNYPNPFSEYTWFRFEHNQPGTVIDVSIQIFSITGSIIRTINTSLSTTGYRSDPIPWDGRDDRGSMVSGGIYIYRVYARTERGLAAEKYGRLVILK